jgi:hypothetical protein
MQKPRRTLGFAGFSGVGDTEFEYARETQGISMIPGIGEAECEALSSDATLRELVQLWSTLDTTVDAPLQWVESITMLRLPEQADQRLQNLMDRNNEGQLTDQERADLAALAELSERLSLVRAEALHLLGRKPS